MENHLHISVDFALVAVPLFPQLCPDHFEEAAKLNGMAAIRLGGETDQLYELEAAYAGYGMGLCQDYMNSTSCRAEENNMSSSANPFDLIHRYRSHGRLVPSKQSKGSVSEFSHISDRLDTGFSQCTSGRLAGGRELLATCKYYNCRHHTQQSDHYERLTDR